MWWLTLVESPLVVILRIAQSDTWQPSYPVLVIEIGGMDSSVLNKSYQLLLLLALLQSTGQYILLPSTSLVGIVISSFYTE